MFKTLQNPLLSIGHSPLHEVLKRVKRDDIALEVTFSREKGPKLAL